MAEHWQLDLLDEMIREDWTGVYQSAYALSSYRDQSWSYRTYIYEKNGQYFKSTWHYDHVRGEICGHRSGPCLHWSWDPEDSITQDQYNALRKDKQSLDAMKKKKSLLRQKRKRDRRRRKEAARREAGPECPKCGKKMDIKKGLDREFWVCPNYPDCKETFKVEPPKTSSDQSVRKS